MDGPSPAAQPHQPAAAGPLPPAGAGPLQSAAAGPLPPAAAGPLQPAAAAGPLQPAAARPLPPAAAGPLQPAAAGPLPPAAAGPLPPAAPQPVPLPPAQQLLVRAQPFYPQYHLFPPHPPLANLAVFPPELPQIQIVSRCAFCNDFIHELREPFNILPCYHPYHTRCETDGHVLPCLRCHLD